MSAELKAQQRDTTLILAVSNPSGRMPHAELFASAIEALDVAERDDDTHAVVITGFEGLVSVVPNLRELAERREPAQAALAAQIASFAGLLDVIRTFSKPVIAAVGRSAEGAGLAAALACDFVVADEDALFGLSQLPDAHLPDSGASWFAARTLPRAIANEMLLAGTPIEAARLYAAGVINKLCANGQATDTAVEWATQLGDRPAGVFSQAKRLLEEAQDRDLQSQMQAEGDALVARLR